MKELLDLGARRSIAEIAELRFREPSMKEVYVEGISDQLLVKRYIADFDISNTAVLCIDTIDIPFEEFKQLELEDNNRSRVIFLARALEAISQVDFIHSVVCLADADFDYLTGRVWSEMLLLFTDFASMELFAWDKSIVQKFLQVYLRRDDIDAEELLSSLSQPLVDLFLIKAVNQILGLYIKPIEIGISFSLDGDHKVRFDSDDYLNRLLSKGAKLSRKSECATKLAELRKLLPPDPRQSIRGHDFVDALSWLLRHRTQAKKAFDEELIGGALMCCMVPTDFDRTKCFSELRRRLTQTGRTQPRKS